MSSTREKSGANDRFEHSRWLAVRQNPPEASTDKGKFWSFSVVTLVVIAATAGIALGIPLGAYCWLHFSF